MLDVDVEKLANALASFEAAVGRLALDAARSIIRSELSRRRPTERRPMRRGSTGRHAVSSSSISRQGPRRPRVDAATPPQLQTTKQKWTREGVLDELAMLLRSGTSIDAAFVARYGPRGLVAAARKMFGRFEAALNVAGLQVARLNPERSTNHVNK